MTVSNKRPRDIQRISHLAAGVLLVLYLYTAVGQDAVAGALLRLVVVPVLILSGLAMWLLPRLRHRLQRRT